MKRNDEEWTEMKENEEKSREINQIKTKHEEKQENWSQMKKIDHETKWTNDWKYRKFFSL